jgi:hypothetical protein
MNKIKSQIDIDSTTLICLFVVVLVGLCSFGLGRLSVLNIHDNNEMILGNTNVDIVKEEIGNTSFDKIDPIKNEVSPKEKMYVASKNGKLYYGTNCSGAKRIATKNEVWFPSAIEAEKAGYTLSSSCK